MNEAKTSTHDFSRTGYGISGCRACDRIFNSVGAFTKHRNHGACDIKGLELNFKGFWGRPASILPPQWGKRAIVASVEAN